MENDFLKNLKNSLQSDLIRWQKISTQHKKNNLNNSMNITNNFIPRHIMQKDFSYGIIPLMQKEGERYTILIHLASGNHR
jgi:hypothetical protein